MVAINELNADTILKDEVFEEVFDEDDLIKRTRVLITLIDRADELGVKKKFEKLLKAYEQVRKEFDKNAKKAIESHNTDFGCETYKELRCGSWIADNNGVRQYTPFQEIVACYHPVLPTQILINAETGREKVKLAFKKRGYWREITVDKGIIASANKIVGLAEFGISVTSENAKALVRFLNDIENYNTDKIAEQISTSKMGWIKDDFVPYDLNIKFDNETRFKEAYESIRSEGDREVWYNLMRDIRQSDRFEPKIYLVGALASVLLKPLNALPFIINLWGETGKGKTVALMLAASVWAYPGENEYVSDPKATVTALELRLDFLNHLPMLLDDMAQVKEKYNGDFSELVYMLCSGKGKDRANIGLGLNKVNTWRNIILTNGERSLVSETMQGGAINRIIDVEMEEGYIFQDGNKVVETVKQNFGFAGKEFVDLIMELGTNDIKEMQQDFLAKIKESARNAGIEKEEKQMIPMSVLLTADKLATDYLFKDDVYLDFDYCISLLKDRNEVSENVRAYEFIMSDIAQNINKYKDVDDNAGEIWGKIEDDYIWILTNVFDNICKRGHFDRRAFLKWADNKGYVQKNEAGRKRLTKRKRIGGILQSCICLKLPIENEQLELEFVNITPEIEELLPFK